MLKYKTFMQGKDAWFLVSASPHHLLGLGEGERERVTWTLYLYLQTSQHYIVSLIFMAFQSLSYNSISFRTLTHKFLETQAISPQHSASYYTLCSPFLLCARWNSATIHCFIKFSLNTCATIKTIPSQIS